MPKVTLEIEVKQSGVDVHRVFSQVDDALQKVSSSALKTEANLKKLAQTMAISAQATVNPYAKAAEQLEKKGQSFSQSVDRVAGATGRASLSTRQMTQAVGAMSMAFGGANPVLASAVLQVSDLGAQMSGLSTRAKLATAGFVSAAVGVSYFINQSREMDRIAGRFTAIERSIAAWDFGAVTHGLRETSAEIDALNRKTSAWLGAFVGGVEDTVRRLSGLPTALGEAGEAERKYMAGL